MSNYIYFSTVNGDFVDNYDIARAYHMISGNTIDPLTFDEIRDIADVWNGIVDEIKKPSVEYLLKRGHKIRAINVFYNEHPELGLEGAREAVEHMYRQLKGKHR